MCRTLDERLVELVTENSRLKTECVIMTLRLMGETEDSMGPECAAVFSKWKPAALKLFGITER